MSDHGHQSRKHRKRNPVKRFLDRLRGRNQQKKDYSKPDFPGINLPVGYDPIAWNEKRKAAEKPVFLDPKEANGVDDSPEENRLNKDLISKKGERKRKRKRPKKSIFDAYKLYLQHRELRREERLKEKIKRQHRRKAEKQHRKINRGPSIWKRIFNLGDGLTDAEREKKIHFFSQRNPIYRNLIITVNSTLIFISTYILVYLFYWLTCMLIASFFGLDSILYYYDLKFNDHSPLWNRLNILFVTGIPPFFSLFLGIFLLRVVFKIKKFAGLQKLFILWSAFHLFNHFFGALPSGIVTDEGFGYVAAWLFMNTAFKFMFSLISLFVLGIIGYYSAKQILETSDSMNRIKEDNRLSFMLFQTAIPWLAGTIILLLTRIPENFNYPYETLMLFSAAFLIFPPFFNSKVKPELNPLKAINKRSISFGYLTMMLLLLAFLRIMLGIGLHFIIEINISISPANI